MRPILVLYAGLFTMGLILAGCGGSKPSIDIHSAWVQEAPASGTASAYMVLQNPTPKEITLISAESNVAKTVEMQSVLQSYKGEQTEQLQKIAVPPMGRIVLEPKNMQLKLLDLQKALKVGDTVTLRLNFDNGTTTSVKAEVRKASK